MTNLNQVFGEIDDWWLQTKGGLENLMDDYGDIVERRIIGALAIPYPPASAAGENPHQRTRNLRAGMGHTVSMQGDAIELEITSIRLGGPTNVPGWLNYGTTKMEPRPYMTLAHQQMEETATQELQFLLNDRMA